MVLTERLGRTRKQQFRKLAQLVVLSYIVGFLVYIILPLKTTSIEALTQFFMVAATLNSTFLVTIAVIFSTLFKEVPGRERVRWIRFFSVAIELLFAGVVFAALILLAFVPSFPDTTIIVSVAVVFILGSWFF